MTEPAFTKSRPRARRRHLKLSEDISTDQLPIAQIYTSQVKTYERMVAESQGRFKVDVVDDDDDDDDSSVKEKMTKNLRYKHKLTELSTESASETEELENPRSRSPSPPPVCKVSTEQKFSRKMKKVIKNLEANARKYQASCVEENTSLDDDDDIICMEDELDNTEIPIKILWQASIIRICMKMNDKFANIFPEVAKKCNANVSEILLTIKDRNITVDDTPRSLNLTLADILDCFVIKSLIENEPSTNENCINLRMQSSDSKEKTNIIVHKVEPLSALMEKYAKVRNLPLKTLCFKFDGEVLSPSDTPVDLDMEDDSCIDVIISKQT